LIPQGTKPGGVVCRRHRGIFLASSRCQADEAKPPRAKPAAPAATS